MFSGERVVLFICCSDCWMREKSEPANGLRNNVSVSSLRSSFVGPQSRVSRLLTKVSRGVAASSCSCCSTLAKKRLTACNICGSIKVGAIRAAKDLLLTYLDCEIRCTADSEVLDLIGLHHHVLDGHVAYIAGCWDLCVVGLVACELKRSNGGMGEMRTGDLHKSKERCHILVFMLLVQSGVIVAPPTRETCASKPNLEPDPGLTRPAFILARLTNECYS